MDATELALSAGVCAEPAEDTPRLVYADWLQENGQDERAEFIRVQCQLAPFDALTHSIENGLHLDKCERCRADVEIYLVRNRERQLLVTKAAEDVWPVTVSKWADKYGFSRGFLSSLTCSAVDFFAHADELMWRPDQTVKCGWCDSGLDRRNPEWGCHECGGTGHMPGKGTHPRPCPPTAQPIEEVTFTDWPRINSKGNHGPLYYLVYRIGGLPGEFDSRELCAVLDIPHRALRVDEIVLGACAIRFKGIKFKVPEDYPITSDYSAPTSDTFIIGT